MSAQIFHFFFVINYIYILVILARQGIRDYLLYMIEIALATGLSLTALAWKFESEFLLIASGFLFATLAIVPSVLTRKIVESFGRKHHGKSVAYSRWRYYLTRANAHRIEYTILKCQWAIECDKPREAIEILEHTPFPEFYTPWLHHLLIVAYGDMEDWTRVVQIFEKYSPPLSSSFAIQSLSRVVEAYCYTGDIGKAVKILGKIESNPHKFLSDDLVQARLCVHAHLGNMGKVAQLIENSPHLDGDYWRGIALCACGKIEEGKERLKNSLVGWRSHPRKNTIENKLKHIANEPQPGISLVPEDLHILKQWEKGDSEEERPPVSSTAWATFILIFLNVIYFIVAESMGGSGNQRAMLNLGSNRYEFVLYQGEYWRFLTSAFLHVDSSHLLLNLIALYFLGGPLERAYGRRNLFIIYFIAAGVSSFISFYWNIAKVHGSVGASGAICGLFGADVWFFLFHAKNLPGALRRHYVFSFLYMIGVILIVGQIFPQMDDAAHFGGIAIGFLSAMALRTPLSQFGRLVYRIVYLIVFWAVVLFCTWSCFHLAQSLGSKRYPECVPSLAWYSLSLETCTVKWGVPFTWKSQENRCHLSFAPHAPLPLQAATAQFRDLYGEDAELVNKFCDHIEEIAKLKEARELQNWENLLIHFSFETFPLENLPNPLKAARENPALESFGDNRFCLYSRRTPFPLDPSIVMEERFYYMQIDECLLQFRFCFQLREWPYYHNSVAKILSSVEVER